MADDLTRLALVARRGDRRALEAFVRAAQSDVWKFCAYLVSPAEADDLTQDTFVRALPALSRFRGDSNARIWLVSIALHVCADSIRGSTRQRRLRDRMWNGEAAVPSHADLVDLHQLIERLDDDRREAFVLTQILGFSYAEAADACGCPVGTIRSRVARARAALCDAIRDPDAPSQIVNEA